MHVAGTPASSASTNLAAASPAPSALPSRRPPPPFYATAVPLPTPAPRRVAEAKTPEAVAPTKLAALDTTVVDAKPLALNTKPATPEIKSAAPAIVPAAVPSITPAVTPAAKTAAAEPKTASPETKAAAPDITGSLPPFVPIGYVSAPAPENGPYRLDSGDRLRVVVFGQDGLSNSYLVSANGNIDMPLIGSVSVRGATSDELSRRIADKLRQGFIREPHVAVEVEAYRPFFILGEVTQPGQYPYVANMTAETAVAIAGGFSPRAYRRTVVLNRVINGEQVRTDVPITYPLRPGDTVNVQERWF